MNKQITNIEPAQLDNLLSLAVGDVISDSKTNTIFDETAASNPVSLDDEPDDEEEEEGDDLSAEEKAAADAAKIEAKAAADAAKATKLIPDEEEEEEEEGSVKKTSGDFVKVLKKLVDDEKIALFDGDKPIEEYSNKEIRELIVANLEHIKETVKESSEKELFESLPDKFQLALAYIQNGGKNLTALYKHLAEEAEVENLDLTNPENQEATVRAWLRETQFGTPEEIEDEIIQLKDRKELDKKSKQFQPKLLAKKEEKALAFVEKQNKIKAENIEALKNYSESVLKTVKNGEINGIKLDNDKKALIYNGLTKFNHTTKTGQATNYLGVLLEKYNRIEPNPELMGEVLLLLSDPKAYRESILNLASKQADEKIFKKLKTTGANKSGGAEGLDNVSSNTEKKQIESKKRQTLARRDFFNI